MEYNSLRETAFEQELCDLIRDLTLLSSWKYNRVGIFSTTSNNQKSTDI